MQLPPVGHLALQTKKNPHEYPMNVPWISHEYPMKPHDIPLNPSKSHRNSHRNHHFLIVNVAFLPSDQFDSDLGTPESVLERHCTMRPPRVPHASTWKRDGAWSGRWGNVALRDGHHYWLVVYLPFWKMMEWKSVGIMTFPTGWKNHPNVPNHQPVITVELVVTPRWNWHCYGSHGPFPVDLPTRHGDFP